MIKIAVCDDEKQVRLRLLTIIQQYFSEIKREVWVAGFKRGQELLSAKVRFDIIFLDIEMPELNGIETAKKLRKWDVKLEDDFIIADEFGIFTLRCIWSISDVW